MTSPLIFSGGVPGPSHIARGVGSDDAWGFSLHGGTLLLALADGAGSHARSAEGASLAVNHSLALLRDALDASLPLTPSLLSTTILSTASFIKAHGGSRAMGSTLLLLASTPSAWVASLVGDSFIVVHEQEGHRLLSAPPAGEYANVTALLTNRVVSPSSFSGRHALGFSLSSDGLDTLTLSGSTPLEGFWSPLVAQGFHPSGLDVPALLAHLSSRSLLSDDTSLLLALWPQVSASREESFPTVLPEGLSGAMETGGAAEARNAETEAASLPEDAEMEGSSSETAVEDTLDAPTPVVAAHSPAADTDSTAGTKDSAFSAEEASSGDAPASAPLTQEEEPPGNEGIEDAYPLLPWEKEEDAPLLPPPPRRRGFFFR